MPLPSRQHDRQQIGSPERPSQHGSAKLWVRDQRRRVAVSLFGRVEDRRGSLGQLATLRFPSSLIEPECRSPASGSPTGFTDDSDCR